MTGIEARSSSMPKETEGYRVLVEMGMEDMAFEAVVLRHPESFSPEAGLSLIRFGGRFSYAA